MENAQYGRMQLGRCVAKSWGHIGCSADVLDLIDTDCSAKRKCLFTVSTLRDRILPCPTDLILYLEARYKCIDGEYWTTTPKLTCCGKICILHGFPCEIRHQSLGDLETSGGKLHLTWKPCNINFLANLIHVL